MSGGPTPSPSRQRVFGPFVLDETTGDLQKHGVRVRLQGQPLQILLTLIREPGRIVSRDEFHQQLWNGSTFVDFDHGLNAAMNRLRQVLGDSADQPRYIETLAGRGYRFVANVQDPEAKPVLVMGPPAAAERKFSSTAKRVWRIAIWMLALLLVVAGIVRYLTGLRPAQSLGAPSIRFTISPPDGYVLEPGSSRQTFALAPDGTRLAFTAMDASGIFQTFVRDLNTVDSKPLPETHGSYNLFWAPDGHSLFLTVQGTLRRKAPEDDSYQVICDTPGIIFSGALLGPNLLLSTRMGNYVVPTSGGTPRPIKELYPWPQVLPDGKHILYTVIDGQSGHHRARLIEFGKPTTERDLLETDSRVLYAPSIVNPESGYLIYLRAGNLLAHPFDPRSLRISGTPLPIVSRIYSFFPTGAADFSVANNGMLAYQRYLSRSQLAWVNRRGEVVSVIGPTNVNLKQGRLSPDGKKIATPIYDVTRGGTDIWIIDSETGAARRAIFGRGLVDNPVWSPDSKKVAFNQVYDRTPKLLVRGVGENDAFEPLPDGYWQVPSDWSPDGRFIAYTNTTSAQVQNEMRGDVWLMDMAHGKVVPLISTPFHETNPAFSPDGRWLAFTSDESGRTEVYIQAFEGSPSPRLVGDRHLVSRQGVISLRWRRDSKELFYLAWDGRVYEVPIVLSPIIKIGEASPLFTISTDARAAIHSLEGFDVSTDGQRFLIPIVTSSEKTEIVVIQNWEAEAQRKHGNVN